MSEDFSALTHHKVHPSSPVLLTKIGPLEDTILLQNSAVQLLQLAHLKFENRSETIHLRFLQSFALPDKTV